MHLHPCPNCERGDHKFCWGSVPSHPPGSYGGSKCSCGCKDTKAQDVPDTITDKARIAALTLKMEELEGHLGWLLESNSAQGTMLKVWLRRERPELARWWEERKAGQVGGGGK